MSLPRFLVPGLAADAREATLPADESHHLARVLRLGAGDAVAVFDGAGREWRARVSAVERKIARVQILEPRQPPAEPPVRMTLGIGLLTHDQMDAVIRDATVLGVSAIVPLSTAHVAAPRRARDSPATQDRWRRVAVAAAKQCGRAVVPVIEPLLTVEECLDRMPADRAFMCVEPGRSSGDPAALAGPVPRTALILVGPEGGWADREIDEAQRRGAVFVHLGPRTLRAQLAPSVVLSALWTLWGW